MTARFDPELSRPLRVEKISANGVEEKIVASEAERKNLAERFDVIDIRKLEAKLHVMPESSGFAVNGKFVAEVTQRCVATLEPLPASIDQNIKTHFAAPELLASDTKERDTSEDDLEPIEDGIIDLGELVAQHLGLALDPYPRKPGAPPIVAEFGASTPPASPFAKLVALKGKSEDKN